MPKKSVLPHLIVAAISAGASAEGFAAVDAAQQVDISILTERAAAGDPKAQRELAYAFIEGRGDGLSQTPARGYAILAQSMMDGTIRPSDAFRLAGFYEREHNLRESARWYRASALAGHTGAQIKVATMLFTSSTNPALTAANQEKAKRQGLALLKHAANAGNPDAAYALAVRYREGNGIDRDEKEAERYLAQAADKGNPQAAFERAEMLMASVGGRRSGRALHYLALAANGGEAKAATMLVDHYLSTNTRNLDLAHRWAERAEALGNNEPLVRVETAIEAETMIQFAATELEPVLDEPAIEATTQGAEVQLSLDDGVAFASAQRYAQPAITLQAPSQPAPAVQVANQPNDSVLKEVQALQGKLDSFEKEMAELRNQLAERDRLMAEYRLRAEQAEQQAVALAGQAEAQRKNASGLNAMRANDHAAALRRFREAADLGNAQAMNNLAMMYMRGQGVPVSMDKAVDYFSQSANLGNAIAATNLGAIYARGLGVPLDLALAKNWYQKAADLGHLGAQNELRRMGSPVTREAIPSIASK